MDESGWTSSIHVPTRSRCSSPHAGAESAALRSSVVPNAMPTPRAYLALATVCALLVAHGSQQQPCDVFCHARLAARAESAGNAPEYASHVRATFGLAPSHPGVVYAMARAFALTGAADSAVAWL